MKKSSRTEKCTFFKKDPLLFLFNTNVGKDFFFRSRPLHFVYLIVWEIIHHSLTVSDQTRIQSHLSLTTFHLLKIKRSCELLPSHESERISNKMFFIHSLYICFVYIVCGNGINTIHLNLYAPNFKRTFNCKIPKADPQCSFHNPNFLRWGLT